MKLLLFSLFPILCQASWQLGAGTGAYLGAAQIQGQWESGEKKHSMQLSFGHTRDQLVKEIRQYSFVYQRSWMQKNYDTFAWDPIRAGIFLTYTDNPHYYFTSPDRYNNDVYYDVNSLRWGLRLSTQITSSKLAEKPVVFSLDGSLLEKGIISYFNNYKEFDVFKYFWSLGFSIRVEI